MNKKYNDYFTKAPQLNNNFDLASCKNIMDKNILNKLVSPLVNRNIYDIIQEINKASKLGKDHVLYCKYMKDYGYSTNILIPYLDFYNTQPIIRDLIIISDPDDSERIAKVHIKKSTHFKFLFLWFLGVSDIRWN